MERLQKYIASCGVASRRHAETMILEGKVKVNNRVITQMGTLIDPDKDKVVIDGKRLQLKKERVYLLLYKPSGYISTCDDPRKRRTVLDLVKDVEERLFPVGRLDYDTEGLLLLTDDGDLANKLAHPRYKIPKTYLVEVEGSLTAEKAAVLQDGVRLEDGLTQPAKVETEYYGKEGSRFSITITEGRNRQVRRMCEALGLPVTYLCRASMGFLDLRGLAPGQYRRLKAQEVSRLKRYTSA
ncbi:MAG: rRNA pseudouridine synthase [Clostridiales bacterium]|nr:rRNA pseudouridine synthase [Clostridiales bacterium]